MKNYFTSLFKSFRQVFTRPGYLFIAIAVVLLIFVVTNILPNYQFASYVVWSDSYSLLSKAKIIFGLSEYFRFNETVVAQLMLILIAIFAGINVSMAAFYFKRKVSSDRLAGVGLLGIFGGFFGVGCGACGSVLLSSLIGVGASTALVNILPFHGAEISLLSLLLLLGSIVYISKKIQDPNVCRLS